jgi:hypothetical protein
MDWAACLANNDVATLSCVPIVFKNIVNIALVLAGATTLIFIIISGLELMNSGGDQKKVGEARATLTWAIVGLLIILGSFAIVNFISFATGVECIKKTGFDNCK